MVATVTTRVWPASTGATTPGSVTVTVAGEPSAGTATRTGATELPSSVRVPSCATSDVPTNSTASAGRGLAGHPGHRQLHPRRARHRQRRR